jgi:hypothetical protein
LASDPSLTGAFSSNTAAIRCALMYSVYGVLSVHYSLTCDRRLICFEFAPFALHGHPHALWCWKVRKGHRLGATAGCAAVGAVRQARAVLVGGRSRLLYTCATSRAFRVAR